MRLQGVLSTTERSIYPTVEENIQSLISCLSLWYSIICFVSDDVIVGVPTVSSLACAALCWPQLLLRLFMSVIFYSVYAGTLLFGWSFKRILKEDVKYVRRYQQMAPVSGTGVLLRRPCSVIYLSRITWTNTIQIQLQYQRTKQRSFANERYSRTLYDAHSVQLSSHKLFS